MRIFIALMAILLSVNSLQAQKKKSKKDKEPVKETVAKDEVVEDVVFEEVVAEPTMTSISSQSLRDENGPYYMYENYSGKDISAVYRNNANEGRMYALLKTSTQSLMTPFIFESLSSHFSQSDYATVSINGLYGTINIKGEIVIPCIYDKFSNFNIDDQIYFIAAVNGIYGVIDEANEIIIPFMYDNLSSIYRMAPNLKAKKGSKYGVLNPVSKKEIIPFLYEDLEPSNSNQIRVKKDNLYNYLDANGQAILTKWYSSLSVYENGSVVARLNGKEGIIDMSEKVYVPFEYDRIERSSLEGNVYQVQKNGKYGIINKDGVVIIPAIYDNLYTNTSTNLIVTLNGRKGVLGKDGQVLLPIEYEEIERSDRNLLVRKNGKSSILNSDLQSLFSSQYEELKAITFDGNYYSSNYLATKAGKKGILDLNGKVLVDLIYDDFIPSSSSYYRTNFKQPLIAIKGGRYGMVDLNNKVIVPFEYEHLQPLNSFLMIVGKKGKYGVAEIYNPTALALPIEYSFIAYKQGKNMVAFKDKFLKFKVSGNKVTPVQ